ncbi:hypothetical protein Fmac_011467 [Flemingia macrophylla]|uniref:Uncharacterized protein n=1 Tax=Flemingia macrophylla TaxID=520843 RepID=A0ABD1MMU9_9FABA
MISNQDFIAVFARVSDAFCKTIATMPHQYRELPQGVHCRKGIQVLTKFSVARVHLVYALCDCAKQSDQISVTDFSIFHQNTIVHKQLNILQRTHQASKKQSIRSEFPVDVNSALFPCNEIPQIDLSCFNYMQWWDFKHPFGKFYVKSKPVNQLGVPLHFPNCYPSSSKPCGTTLQFLLRMFHLLPLINN